MEPWFLSCVGNPFLDQICRNTRSNYNRTIGKNRKVLDIENEKSSVTRKSKLLRSFALSKLAYFLINLPSPPDKQRKNIDKTGFDILWNEKSGNTEREVTAMPCDDGSIEVADVDTFEKARKLS